MLTDRSESSEIDTQDSIFTKIMFGHQPSPELLAILMVYAVQGILGISRLAVSFFLKDELALSPAEVAALMGIAALPWVIKPVFGFISDGLPIFGYRRRPYLILSGLLGVGAWLSLAYMVHTTTAATIAIAITSLSVAFSDVIVDSLIVERARDESVGKAGSLQALCWGASAVGGLLTAYFSGLLLEHFSTRTVFAFTAAFPLLVSAAAVWIAEEPVAADGARQMVVKEQMQQLWQALTQKAIWMPTVFLFIWQCTPTADSAFFYFSTNELGFTPEFLGRVRLVTSLASLLGVWLFQRFLKTIPFRKIFIWTTLFSSLLGLTALLLVTHTNRTLGIDDHWFALGDSLILTVMGQLTFMPVLVLAARLCPPGIEATLFALLMSVLNLSGLVSKEGGAILTHLLGVTDTNFDKLWLLVLIANVGSMLPLIFINLLPNEEPQLGANTSRSIPPSSAIEHSQTGIIGNQSFIPDMLPEILETKAES
ncbi:folate/biopterin family MFS transporter [Chamaesiphon sp. GL140_3_metabinner_50]|uniref:folate/biopterin family MFS transporter n=1 Tax=Chamaesiphon sp. GL140_3_metabinner_50 TaxID=2970812 RepID=UPI0025FDCE9C|nr:folate/biopterin family MFS transporter [Chamaesiphon sp. GL140_3_metabinner_50]